MTLSKKTFKNCSDTLNGDIDSSETLHNTYIFSLVYEEWHEEPYTTRVHSVHKKSLRIPRCFPDLEIIYGAIDFYDWSNTEKIIHIQHSKFSFSSFKLVGAITVEASNWKKPIFFLRHDNPFADKELRMNL